MTGKGEYSACQTLWDLCGDEGWNKGYTEGAFKKEIEIAKRMLAEGSDIAFVLKVTQLSIETVKALQSKK